MKISTRLGRFLPIAAAGALLVIFSACKADETDNVLPNYDISGTATGAQVVPSVAGTATATLSGTFNPNSKLLTYTSNWNGLSGAPTGGGFYSGASGVSGNTIGTPWVFNGSLTGTGSTSGSVTLTAEQAEELLLGRIYFSYTTAFNPGGEVRGQVNTSR